MKARAILIWIVGLGTLATDSSAQPGTLDPTFAPVDVNGSLYAMKLQEDGKLLLGGGFIMVNDEARWSVARVNADGSLDGSFLPALAPQDGGMVLALEVQADGKVVVGNDSGLLRLHADGSRDTDFSAAWEGTVMVTRVLPDGRILVGGSRQVLGYPNAQLARLYSDGSLDPTFHVDSFVGHGGYSWVSD